MSTDFPLRILLIDDDPVILHILCKLLAAQGFICRTASDGFEALRHLRQTPPDIIISDLNMPNMSGFELLSIVRRRFPQIPVIVHSGEFVTNMPTSGLLMNAFFQKGASSHMELIAAIYDLHSQHPIRPYLPKPDHAPLWISRRNDEFLIATCTECLRSFPVEHEQRTAGGVQAEECPSCGTVVAYAVTRNLAEVA